MGTPKFEKTKEQSGLVTGLALAGYRDSDICEVIGCAESTLKKHFAEELAKGRVLANGRVIQSLFQNAISGNVTAQIFWAKTRLGWVEKQEVEVTHNERRMTDEELLREANLANRETKALSH